MDSRDSGGSRSSAMPAAAAAASFNAFYQRAAAGYAPESPLITSSIMRHASSSQPHALVSNTDSFPHDTMMPVSPAPGMGMWLSRSEPVKRKRGRPRKYATDANGVALGLSPLPLSVASPREKPGRGSAKKAQLSALGATGQGFTPHVLTVAAGEDVATKIMSFSQHGPWAVCILTANGAISNATLRHAGVSGGTVTYEGRFEILSLSGSFLLIESGEMRSRTGGLSVSLAGPDGRVIGGGVAGLLMAATPVQVVVGTFFSQSRKNNAQAGSGKATSGMPPDRTAAGTQSSAPIIQQTHMDATGAMQDHISAGGDEEQHRVSHVQPLQSMDWGGSQFDVETRGHN